MIEKSKIKNQKSKISRSKRYLSFIISHFSFLERGFTFIELIVVFSVISILSSVGIASLVAYSRNQQLSSAMLEIVSSVELAKSRSSSQVKPGDCLGQLQGYKIELDKDENQYELTAVCATNTILISKATLPKNISFGSETAPAFFFPVISGGVDKAGKIVLTGYNKTKTTEVNASGIIYKEPAPT